MSRRQWITVVAIVVLIATVPITWGIAEVRSIQAAEADRADLPDEADPIAGASIDDRYRDHDDRARPPRRPGERTDGPRVVETTGAS